VSGVSEAINPLDDELIGRVLISSGNAALPAAILDAAAEPVRPMRVVPSQG